MPNPMQKPMEIPTPTLFPTPTPTPFPTLFPTPPCPSHPPLALSVSPTRSVRPRTAGP